MRFTKDLSSSEAKNKIQSIDLKVYTLYTFKDGGSQASINMPEDFMRFAFENEILIEDNSISEKIKTEKIHYKVYSLSNEYRLIFDRKIEHMINAEENTDYGFFVIKAENTKYQIRPKAYDDINSTSDLNYSWLRKFIDKSLYNNKLIIYCDKLSKTLKMSYEEKAFINSGPTEGFIVEEKETKVYLKDSMKSPLQIIYFGAPGTGKSYNISEVIKKHSWIEYDNELDIDSYPNIFRQTLFPDYSYHDFIGSVLPVVKNDRIKYEFTPGVFTQSLSYAFANPSDPVYLVLEEMSRTDVASVFGDIFQLLDRNDEGVSVYKINNNLIAREISKVDNSFYSDIEGKYNKVFLPENFSIIGTINSNDQNVFPMDTAFKRRFDFSYLSTKPILDFNGKPINNFIFEMHGKQIQWINFYTKLNEFIITKANLGEDKQIGQFFIQGNNSDDAIEINSRKVKNKLLNYLWLDVNPAIFNGEKIFNEKYSSFSQVYDSFDEVDVNIFSFNFDEEKL